MEIIAGKEAEYAKYVTDNDDPYGAGVVAFGAKWADLMESEIATGKTVEAVAKDTASRADTEGNYILDSLGSLGA